MVKFLVLFKYLKNIYLNLSFWLIRVCVLNLKVLIYIGFNFFFLKKVFGFCFNKDEKVSILGIFMVEK